MENEPTTQVQRQTLVQKNSYSEIRIIRGNISKANVEAEYREVGETLGL